MSVAAITASGVSKRFRLGETHDSLRDLLSSAMRRILYRSRKQPHHAARNADVLNALDDISFEVRPGESLGIIGPNGAGKSTMLKLLAGILRPDRGTIRITGRLAALIEIGAGFHGDLTGRENIFLNGAILGMARDEIRRKLDAIVEFAGLARFLDTPVKRYSSGMYARLGFSIAAHVDPDVLLVDEVLSVGDALFRLRCLQRMRELLQHGATLVFVTHDLDQMQSVCQRALVLEGGRTSFLGPARDAVSNYMLAMSRSFVERPPDLTDGHDRASGDVDITGLYFYDAARRSVSWTRAGEPVDVALAFRLRRDIQRLVIELNMRQAVHQNLLSINSGRDGQSFSCLAGEHRVRLSLPALPVAGGQYVWNVRMWDADTGRAEIDTPFRFPLGIEDGGCKTGVICVPHQWACDKAVANTDRILVSAVASAAFTSERPAFNATSAPFRAEIGDQNENLPVC